MLRPHSRSSFMRSQAPHPSILAACGLDIALRRRCPWQLSAAPHLGAVVKTWSGDSADITRLVDALRWWTGFNLPLRTRRGSAQAVRLDRRATLTALPGGHVALSAGRGELTIQDFLDANPGLAVAAGLSCPFADRHRRTWDPFENAVAWARSGGSFDLAPERRPSGSHALGWRFDHAFGEQRASDGGLCVRLIHPWTWDVVRVPRFALPSCMPHHNPLRRLRSINVPHPLTGESVGVTGLSLDPLRLLLAGGRGAADTLSIEELVVHEPAAETLVRDVIERQTRQLYDDVITRLEQVGFIQLPETTQDTCPRVGWSVNPHSLKPGARVELTHTEARPRSCTLAEVHEWWVPGNLDASSALMDDLTRWPVSEGETVPAFVVEWDSREVFGSSVRGGPVTVQQRIGTFLLRNPTRLPAILALWPELVLECEDPGLVDALRELFPGTDNCLEPYVGLLEEQPPVLTTSYARSVVRDALAEHDTLRPAVRLGGREASRVFSVSDDEHFIAWRDVTDAQGTRLPCHDHGVWDGPVCLPGPWRVVTRHQLALKAPDLTRWLRSVQMRAFAIDADGRCLDRCAREQARLNELLGQLENRRALLERHGMRLGLHEEPGARSRLQAGSRRVGDNIRDLQSHGVAIRIREENLPRLGVMMQLGDPSPGTYPAAEDRVRYTDAVVATYLGRFSLALVGGGDPSVTPATGPRVATLLQSLERAIASAVHRAPTLNHAFDSAFNAMRSVIDAAEESHGWCSAVIYLQHEDGWGEVYNCGATGAWLVGRDGVPHPCVAWGTFEGIVWAAHASGLDPADALRFALTHVGGGITWRAFSLTNVDDMAGDFVSHRRHAIRAAVGTPLTSRESQTRRLKQLADAVSAQRPTFHRAVFDEMSAGVFRQRIQPQTGRRVILGTDGLRASLGDPSPVVVRRLRRSDPERLMQGLHRYLEETSTIDDAAGICLVPHPLRRCAPQVWFHEGNVWRVTPDQTGVADTCIVPGMGISRYHRVKCDHRLLRDLQRRLDDVIRRGTCPRPASDEVGFVAGVARWLATRRGGTPPTVEHDDVVELSAMSAARPHDPMIEALLLAALCTRRGAPVTLYAGWRDEQPTAWVQCGPESTMLVDPNAHQIGAVPTHLALGDGVSRSGILSRGMMRWRALAKVWLGVPLDERGSTSEDRPFERLHSIR